MPEESSSPSGEEVLYSPEKAAPAPAQTVAPVPEALVTKKISFTAAPVAATPSAAGTTKLSVRKLSFDSATRKLAEAASGGANSSAARASDMPATDGLPSLLKRLRADAQAEIEKATASVTQLHVCLSREIRSMEAERQELLRTSQERVDSLRATIDKLREDVERLQRERSEMEQRLLKEKADVVAERDASVRAQRLPHPPTHCCCRHHCGLPASFAQLLRTSLSCLIANS